MILEGPISLLDCVVYLFFLAPQLLIQVGLLDTLRCALPALPFLVFRMPPQLIRERYFMPACPPGSSQHNPGKEPGRPSLEATQQSPFVKHASLFQDLVIRCVRYAFAEMPARIGAVFFCKPVALPFMRWRMLRHGFLRSPVHYEEIDIPPQKTDRSTDTTDLKAIYLVADPSATPDVLIYYLHGGGFSMGSSYFYLEFLMSWITLLQTRRGFHNPAILALEYSLVPSAVYPTQLRETRAGYEECLRRAGRSERIVVAGDSAGATLALSLLLSLAQDGDEATLGKPGFATLISPWCELVSESNKDTRSDYLNADSLHLYARQYAGDDTEGKEDREMEDTDISGYVRKHGLAVNGKPLINGSEKHKRQSFIDDPIASPGHCSDINLWRRAIPQYGYHFIMGAEEVFAPNARGLVSRLKKAGSIVNLTDQEGQIHAWPVVNLFLKDRRSDRLQGLCDMTDRIGEKMGN